MVRECKTAKDSKGATIRPGETVLIDWSQEPREVERIIRFGPETVLHFKDGGATYARLTTKPPEFPEWIKVQCHVSIGWKALCLQCQKRHVGKLKDCVSWAKEHARVCEGATCGDCGTKFSGLSWDTCPTCGESACVGNRVIDADNAGMRAAQTGGPSDPPAERTETWKKAYSKGYDREAAFLAEYGRRGLRER